MDSVKGGRDIFGFSLNATYSSNEAIWEEVKNTGKSEDMTMGDRFVQPVK